MPYVVSGELGQGSGTASFGKDLGYDYPNGLDLQPNSDLHKSIKDKILQRARESNNEMSKRYSSWNSIDKTLTTYIPLSDKEELIKEKDTRKPVSIIFPYTYSMLESLLTYLCMAFFQDPIFPYEGVGPEDIRGAMLMELVIRLQCIKTKVALSIHTTLRDSLAYGIGVGIPGWERRFGKRAIQSSVVTESPFGQSTSRDVQWINDLIFEGNKLDNVDPYMWFPDPSVSSHKVQDGEFVGWMVKDNYMSLLSEETNSGGKIFNVKYLKELRHYRSTFSIDQSERTTKFGGTSRNIAPMSTNPVDCLYMYVNLIPKDWKLGSSEYPEKWLFCLAADQVIISMEKADHAHGLYPVAVASPEFDGYSVTPIGRLEILYGLQGVLDWMFNSHVSNVRKAINDMLVVDPYLVNINDLKDPQPGKLIRLRRPAWGKGVDKVVQQLVVQDITRQNIADSAYITQWMDRISGADQSMSGYLRTQGPERLTRSEFQGTRGSAISRLQRVAMIIGLQFMQDIGTMFAAHAQQYMTKDTYVKTVGRHQEQLNSIFGQQQIQVTPYDLAIDYDLVVRDGSIPGGNFSDAWLQMFQIIGTTPELYQYFDIPRIFMYIATQLGAKNVDDFRRNLQQVQPQVMPDQAVADQLQRGNIVPFGATQ